MKIAYIVPSLANKGPVIVVKNLTKELVGMGVDIEVLYFDDKPAMDFDCLTRKIDAAKPIEFDNYDIIHSNGFRPDKYVAKWRKKIRKAKTISTIHSDIAKDLKYSHNLFISILITPLWLKYISKLNGCAVTSEKLRNVYSDCGLNQLYRVYNGVNISINTEKTEKSIVFNINILKDRGYMIIGVYAHITPIKGIEQLINAVAKDLKLAAVIIGEGREKQNLIKLAAKLKIEDRVLFFDYLKEPFNYLPLFDAYAMCSRSEGFGLALVEAAMCGCPVVCSNIDIFREIFDDSQASFFKLDDIDSLNNALNIAISQEGILKKEKAQKRVEAHFTSLSMANNYLKVYRSLIENGKI